jgi:hypothetical protein
LSETIVREENLAGFSLALRYVGKMATTLQENLNEMAHRLQIKFGLPPTRPTSSELRAILADVDKLPSTRRTDADWKRIVFNHVHFTGIYKTEGVDMSDLNSLQAQIMLLLG